MHDFGEQSPRLETFQAWNKHALLLTDESVNKVQLQRSWIKLVRPLSTVENTCYARVFHSRQWSNYNENSGCVCVSWRSWNVSSTAKSICHWPNDRRSRYSCVSPRYRSIVVIDYWEDSSLNSEWKRAFITECFPWAPACFYNELITRVMLLC